MKLVTGFARGRGRRVGLVVGIAVAGLVGLALPASAHHASGADWTGCVTSYSTGGVAIPNSCCECTTTTQPATTTTEATTTTTAATTTTTEATTTTTTTPETTTSSTEVRGSTTFVTTTTQPEETTTTFGEQGGTVPTTEPATTTLPAGTITLPRTGGGVEFPAIFGGLCIAAGAALALRKRSAWS